ncbi:hypothetical protein [Phenylobacterium sp.]|jgi:hypothetical protein|uniref:hypothetical protein n=1 Tax=Phenylobacterium sp. TaxID=1871053 RepID=UPI002E376EA1|nr:hypothetical protein [Phenylobacterium sp.]HEX4712062.1 hypothetical protein [Phenylobacterium sp.]
MSDAGYTLSETLAAMAVLGMAIGGLTLGAQVVGSLQLSTSRSVSQLQSVRAAQAALEQMLARGAPFGSQQPDQFAGDAQGFRFACGAPQPCSAQILTAGKATQLKLGDGKTSAAGVGLPLSTPAHFIYRGAKTASTVWPPTDPTRQALRSVALLQTATQGETALIEARIWAEQSAQCAFDSVMQDCR